MSARDPRIRLVKADEKKSPPREKDVAGGAECSTIQREELRRRWMEFRRAYLAMEAFMRSQGIDLTTE